MPRIIASVQIRMTSERLPGKSLMLLDGMPLLALLLERVGRSKKIDGIVVGTPVDKRNDPIETLCKNHNIPCFRGPEDDVLERMLGALTLAKADIGLQVYGDSPLIDRDIIDMLIDEYQKGGNDWVGNDLVHTFPSGQFLEVFSMEALRESAKKTNDIAIREHGTLFIRKNPGMFRLKNIEAKELWHRPDLHFDVDTAEDLAVIDALMKHFAPRRNFSLEEMIAFIDSHPQIATGNASVHRRWKEHQPDGPSKQNKSL